tara:strand:- start:687 stop:881 length:195 start_codon:yes stop_codon:yes gene_type:complete
MKLYELTDKGRALLAKPRHPEPTNWEHCCSCCAVLEKELKQAKQELADERATFKQRAERWWNHG